MVPWRCLVPRLILALGHAPSQRTQRGQQRMELFMAPLPPFAPSQLGLSFGRSRALLAQRRPCHRRLSVLPHGNDCACRTDGESVPRKVAEGALVHSRRIVTHASAGRTGGTLRVRFSPPPLAKVPLTSGLSVRPPLVAHACAGEPPAFAAGGSGPRSRLPQVVTISVWWPGLVATVTSVPQLVWRSLYFTGLPSSMTAAGCVPRGRVWPISTSRALSPAVVISVW
jgi:hypothetical protein